MSAENSFSPMLFCPVHGIFSSSAIVLGNGTVGTFFGGKEECPRCERLCEVIPGTYEMDPRGLNVLIHPSISQGALVALRSLTERLQDGEITLEQAQTEAAKIAPILSKLFDITDWPPGAKATLYGSIIGAVALIYAARSEQGPKVQPQPQITIQNNIELPPRHFFLMDPNSPLPSTGGKGRKR